MRTGSQQEALFGSLSGRERQTLDGDQTANRLPFPNGALDRGGMTRSLCWEAVVIRPELSVRSARTGNNGQPVGSVYEGFGATTVRTSAGRTLELVSRSDLAASAGLLLNQGI